MNENADASILRVRCNPLGPVGRADIQHHEADAVAGNQRRPFHEINAWSRGDTGLGSDAAARAPHVHRDGQVLRGCVTPRISPMIACALRGPARNTLPALALPDRSEPREGRGGALLTFRNGSRVRGCV